MTTWSPKDLSVGLGREFLDRFYQQAIEDESTAAYGAGGAGREELACWCLGFIQYTDFNAKLIRSFGPNLLVLVFRRLMTGRIGPGQLIYHFFGPKANRKAKCPEVLLGAFGLLGNKFEDVMLLSKLTAHVTGLLTQKHPACWAETRSDNRGARAILKAANFQLIDEIEFWKRKVAVYEHRP